MKLADLIVENKQRSMTGSHSIDKIFEQISSESSSSTIPDSLPIAAKEEKWKKEDDPDRLTRSFKFDNISTIKFFLNEILEYQEDRQHHATIIISEMDVTIETYTKDVNLITEMDLQLAKFCDNVYEDIKFIRL